LSVSEFEAVAGQAIIKIDKALYGLGEVPALKDAKRSLETLVSRAREPARLKELRDKLDATAEVVRAKLSDDTALHDDLWDLMDFIDYRC